MVLVATQVKRRRGTTAENDAFTGAEGEITVDTEKHELRVHDGLTQGGFKVGSGTGALIIGQIIEVVGTADYAPVGCLLADGAEYTKAQFPDLWADFLTGTPKLQTCTYTEYANQIAEFGFCNKFAVDTTNETFKVPTRNKYRKLVKKIINSNSWANIYDDGWCEQGGRTSNFTNTNASTSGTKTVTLVVPMSSTNYTTTAVLSAENSSVSGYASRVILPRNFTTTEFLIDEWNNAESSSTSCYATWRVSGYTTIPDSTSNITREFVVVANGTLNQEQMDWSAWASSLAGKTNIDLDNLSSEGKSMVANLAMPSNNYVNLTLGASGATYTAPADGYVAFSKYATGANQTINITCNHFISFVWAHTGSINIFTWMPVKKGDVFTVGYSAAGTYEENYFRFIYAEGAQ